MDNDLLSQLVPEETPQKGGDLLSQLVPESAPAQPRQEINPFQNILTSAAKAGYNPETLNRLANTNVTPGNVDEWIKLRMEHEQRRTGQPVSPQVAEGIYRAFHQYSNFPVEGAQSTGAFKPWEPNILQSAGMTAMQPVSIPIAWGTKKLLPAIRAISPQAAENIAPTIPMIHRPGSGVSGFLGGLIEAPVKYSNPLFAGVVGAMNSDLASMEANEQGANIPAYKQAIRAITSGVVDYAIGKFMANPTIDPKRILAGDIQESALATLNKNVLWDLVRYGVPKAAAKRIAPMILSGGVMMAGGTAQNIINEQPITGRGMAKEFAIGAAIPPAFEVAGKVLGTGAKKLGTILQNRRVAQEEAALTPKQPFQITPFEQPPEPSKPYSIYSEATPTGVLYQPKETTGVAEIRTFYNDIEAARQRMRTEPNLPPEERQTLQKKVDSGMAEVQAKLMDYEQKYGEDASENLLQKLQSGAPTKEEGVSLTELPPTHPLQRGFEAERVGQERLRDLLSKMRMDKVKADYGESIPLGAGIDESGQTVYIDPLMPKEAGGIPTEKPLVAHEVSEQQAMNQGQTYAEGHVTATQLERQVVERMGGNWEQYQAEMAKATKQTEKQPVSEMPTDIEKRPYQQTSMVPPTAGTASPIVSQPPTTPPTIPPTATPVATPTPPRPLPTQIGLPPATNIPWQLPSPPTPPTSPVTTRPLPSQKGVIGRTLENIHEGARQVFSWIGSETGRSQSGQQTANELRSMLGHQKLEAAKLEGHFTPDVELGKTLTPDQGIRLVDEIGSGQPVSDPRFQSFQKKKGFLNESSIKRAKALGWDVSKWSEDWLGRIFEWADENGKFAGDSGYSAASSLARRESFLKGRTYDTYAEAHAAITASGGRPKFSNPIEMSLAKDIEVSNSLVAHEAFLNSIQAGAVRVLKAGEKPLATEELITDPIRWTHDPQQRRYVATKDVAEAFNYLSSDRPTSKIADLIIRGNQLAQRAQMMVSLHHYMTESQGAGGIMWGQATKDILRLNWPAALREIGLGLPVVGTPELVRRGVMQGRAAVAEAKTSAVSEFIASGGGEAGPHGSKIFDTTHYAKAKEYFDAGNDVAGMREMAMGVISAPNQVLFEQFIPNLRRGVLAVVAQSEIEQAQRWGRKLDSPGMLDLASKHVINVSNLLGVKDELIHFQNKTAAVVNRIFMGFPNWYLGKARFTEESVKGIAPLFKGQNMDPATYTMIGLFQQKATIGVALHYMFTGQWPTKWQDVLHIPTGLKDKDGRDIRFNTTSPADMIFDIAAGDKTVLQAFSSRLGPFMRFANAMATNKDFEGMPTRDTWTDIARTIGDIVTPISLSSAARLEDAPAGWKIAAAAGAFRPSSKRAGMSEAEKYASDIFAETTHPETREEKEHAKTLKDMEREVRKGKFEVFQKAGEMVRSGQLAERDLHTILQRAKDPAGLSSWIESPEIKPQDVMETWKRMTPEEKSANRWRVIGRIAKHKPTFDFTAKDVLTSLKQISEDLKGVTTK